MITRLAAGLTLVFLAAFAQPVDAQPANGYPPEGYIQSTDGVELYYRVMGSGPDTLVVLHGGAMGLPLEYLAPDLEPLARSYTLIFYDHRGSGRSTIVADAEQMQVASNLRDLEAVRAHFVLEQMMLLGHSWGAGLAALYAAGHTDRIQRLVLVGPMAIRNTPYTQQCTENLYAWMDDTTREQVEVLAARMAELGGEPDPHATCRSFWRLWMRSFFSDPADVTLQPFNLMRRNAVDERAREHQYVIISPMTHCNSERATENTRVGELDVGDARFPYWQIYLRWFDHWLKDEENGVTDMPRVQYYVSGANEWRSADEWPVPEARPTRLYLRSGGEAGERMDDGVLAAQPPTATEPPDRYVYDPGDPMPSRGGTLCCTGNPQDQPGAYDQSDLEQRDDVLVYTTAPLDDPLDVVGALRATLYVSSSAPDTDFTVKLVDVHPDGRAFNVQEGILRARYREEFDRTVWMQWGEVYEVEVDLHVTAHRFLAGHRVRLEVSSSNFPRFDRNLNTGGDNVTETEWRIAENEIHHSPEHPSHLLLPVVSSR